MWFDRLTRDLIGNAVTRRVLRPWPMVLLRVGLLVLAGVAAAWINWGAGGATTGDWREGMAQTVDAGMRMEDALEPMSLFVDPVLLGGVDANAFWALMTADGWVVGGMDADFQMKPIGQGRWRLEAGTEKREKVVVRRLRQGERIQGHLLASLPITIADGLLMAERVDESERAEQQRATVRLTTLLMLSVSLLVAAEVGVLAVMGWIHAGQRHQLGYLIGCRTPMGRLWRIDMMVCGVLTVACVAPGLWLSGLWTGTEMAMMMIGLFGVSLGVGGVMVGVWQISRSRVARGGLMMSAILLQQAAVMTTIIGAARTADGRVMDIDNAAQLMMAGGVGLAALGCLGVWFASNRVGVLHRHLHGV